MRYLHQIDPIAFGSARCRRTGTGSCTCSASRSRVVVGRRRICAGRLPGVDETGFGDLMFYCMLGVVLGGRIANILFTTTSRPTSPIQLQVPRSGKAA